MAQREIEYIKKAQAAFNAITTEAGKIIIGQRNALELLMIVLLCGGHSIIVGVPGVAKTLMIKTLAQTLSLTFKRIQFTPDLMPSDITGTDVLEEDRTTGRRTFRFVRGPLFANIVLADEINRAPPKTQSALLEAMQEKIVTVGERDYQLPDPFFVFATQNPVEFEGTYPLPEAQLDRFMMMIKIDYPTPDEEIAIAQLVSGHFEPNVRNVFKGEDLVALHSIVKSVPVASNVLEYAQKIVAATRPQEMTYAGTSFHNLIQWGAGPRATIHLITAAKAKAILSGRCYVMMEDIRSLFIPVIAHRIVRSFQAEAEGVSSDVILQKILEEIKA